MKLNPHMAGENERLTSELAECRARYKQTLEELKRDAKAECERCLQEERVKWERREATLYAQLEAMRAGMSGGSTTISAPLVRVTSVTDASTSFPFPGTPRTLSETPRVSRSEGTSVSSDLRATASEFAPIAAESTRPKGGAIPSSIYSPPRMSPTVSYADPGTTVAATSGLSLPTTIPLLTSSTRTDRVASAPVILSATTTPPSPIGGASIMPTLSSTSPLPPICKFRGEDPDQEGGNFEEWIEQFEMIADAYGWNARTRLVNLTTRLQGQAYSFYRTCSPEQRTDYERLKAQMMTRFTPVRLQAVHSNLFHQRKQGEAESVDQYAQELRKLFYRAYPRASQATEQAEGFRKSVLAYQFVAGLKKNLQSRVAGIKGDFDQLLLRARFEEAKIRDLSFQND